MLLSQVETPSYIIDEGKLIKNLKVLEWVQQEAGCKILLAQKAFSNFCVYPLIGQYLAGTTASGLYEARLGKEEMGKENHVFAPAYKEADMDELVKLCDHIIFNSVVQLMKYKDKCLKAGVSIGLRVNPECSTQGDHAIYDPCSKGSRLGVTLSNLQQAIEKNPDVLKGVDGLHFHTLCEQNSDDLETTIEVVKEKFGQFLDKMSWINMGGGHHISREDYDVNRLIRIIKDVKETYDIDVYLEPGEAIALNAGYLMTEVLDIVDNEIKTLILDTSAACHMPDVLEMPYRPPLMNSYEWDKKPYKYRLSSYTCLAGDIIGDYSFNREIKVGDRLVFEDMAIYSMVKNNTFNGIPLPSIYLQKQDGDCQLIKKFGYEDFKNRLS
ncbi:carboxynorspermidine decarboxylase [Pseudobutyrivibrio xylanivorans]|uniref:Carboxynorspermidine decarboxylase n=1 Tax=Pseudobutyrivibrio xylanivorans TaxID=185007 RepID=A0A1G5S060_PSEXY|nr:carboxynorspermidine decarboxylase [Pseudobutyrivibrio xylanivorans]SCZ78969.1 carboxynorspermidine decarboxylase [Pseudobutyrivibrio xylanivorans]